VGIDLEPGYWAAAQRRMDALAPNASGGPILTTG
jgi:hypothetical protein